MITVGFDSVIHLMFICATLFAVCPSTSMNRIYLSVHLSNPSKVAKPIAAEFDESKMHYETIVSSECDEFVLANLYICK